MSDETKPDLPATTEDEANTELNVVTEDAENTKLDTVADLVSSLNLPIWIARNASKAFRQLCSAAVEWPAAFFKGKAAEKHAITTADTKITEAVTDQIIQQIEVPPEYAQIAVKKHIEKIIGEQINLDKTVAIAADELKNEQSDNSTNQGTTSEPNEDQSADSTNQDVNHGQEKVIDDVWLNIFETEARPQSTEEAQLLFGRILAGEIKNPGSYSIKTVKALGEMDQKIAALFKKLCSACVVYGIFGILNRNRDMIFDIRVSSLGGDPGSNVLEKYGLGYGQLNLLNEYNLIISSYNSYYTYNMCIVSQDNQALPFKYQGKYWVLSPLPERKNKPELRISGVALTHVGRELFHIVDQDPMLEYTQELKKFFAEQNLAMVEVSINRPRNGTWNYSKVNRIDS